MPTNTPNLNLIKPLVTEHYDVVVANANNDTLDTEVASKAPKADPTFTGTQTLPNIVTNGIKFPATQVPSSDPNTLDDYEEGTFTPVVIGSTTAGEGTYTANRYGKYTKIGNLVYVNIFIEWTAHTGTGNLRITGLPFNSSSYGTRDIPNILSYNLTANANHVITGEVPSNGSFIYILQYPVGGGAYLFVPLDTSASIELSLTYLI